MKTPILSLLTLALTAQVGNSQIVLPGVSGPSASDCSAAISTLQSGSLAAVDSQTQAANLMSACGTAGANAVATAMLRRSTGTLTADTYAVFSPTSRDTAVMNAAISLASNSGATVAVRVLSLGILNGYIGQGYPSSYAALTGITNGDGCGPALFPSDAYSSDNLASNAPELIEAQVVGIEHSSTEPAAVRSAANCVINTWRALRQLPTQPLAAFSSPPVLMQYFCGRRFRVRSTSPYVLQVQYDVDGGPRSILSTAPPPSGQTYGYSELQANAWNSTVRLYFDGQLVNTIKGTGAGCP